MDADALLVLLGDAAAVIGKSLEPVRGDARRARTSRPGQYAIDLVADAAALEVLAKAPVAVLSEESGWGGVSGAAVTVVLDPVDGSTNAARGLPYWGTSLCAVDGGGLLAALVVNQATGVTTTAVRGGGVWRDGVPVRASTVARVEDAVVALAGMPERLPAWKQFRALGSAALALCDVAAGVVDGYLDAGAWHAPWDYLGGLLACREAGAVVVDARGRELVCLDESARLQVVAASTPSLLDALVAVAPSSA